MKLTSLTVLTFLFLAIPSYGQFDYGSRLVGFAIKPGLSYSYGDPASQNRTPANQLVAAMGFYRYYSVNKKNESLIPFHYLKVEANLGMRSGLFTINDLNQTAVVDSRYIELILLAPFTWEINDHVAANIGLGGGVVWVRGQTVYSDITPAPTVNEGNPIKGSVMLDYHLLFAGKSNAVVGSRILVESSRFAYGEWSIYFGFGLQVQKLKDRIKKWSK
jgi:hypothetical protein